MKTVQIGSAVKVVDEVGYEHAGIVTAAWGSGPEGAQEYEEAEGGPAVNIIFVSADPKKTDCYGRQTEHLSSTMHRSKAAGCPGRYWWQE